jgi:hypothetical protein
MPPESAAQAGAHPGHSWKFRLRRLGSSRAVWPYFLAAAALLALSEILWLWHSWPVRQVLESEQLSVGASL